MTAIRLEAVIDLEVMLWAANDPFRTLWVCLAGSQAPQSNHSTILSSNSRVDPMRALLNGASWFIAGTQKSRKL